MSNTQKSKLRVGFDATWLANSHKSGVGAYLEQLVTSLASNYSDELELIGFIPAGLKYQPDDLVTASNVSYKKSKLLPLKLINLLRRFGIELPFELLIKTRADFLLFPAFTSYPSLFKTASAVVIHDLSYIDQPNTVRQRNRQDLVRNVPKAINRSSFIVTISEWTKRRITENYKTDKSILVTPIPPSPPLPSPDKQLIRKLGIKGSFILFVGTLEPRKNVTGLLKAYQNLDSALQQKYSLVLAGGKGWNNSDISATISDLQQSGLNIVATGYVTDEQKAALYSQASLFTLPSFYEGFGMPLLEAMTYKVPVVASDIEVFHEVCGKAAVYCNPQDYQAIAKQIKAVLENDNLTKELVASGKTNLERFDWPTVANSLFDQIKGSLAK